MNSLTVTSEEAHRVADGSLTELWVRMEGQPLEMPGCWILTRNGFSCARQELWPNMCEHGKPGGDFAYEFTDEHGETWEGSLPLSDVQVERRDKLCLHCDYNEEACHCTCFDPTPGVWGWLLRWAP